MEVKEPLRAFFISLLLLCVIIPSCEAIPTIEIDNMIEYKWGYLHYKSQKDSLLAYERGIAFGEELKDHISDFKKEGDLMVHVSTFCIIKDTIYMTYYANRVTINEDPSQR